MNHDVWSNPVPEPVDPCTGQSCGVSSHTGYCLVCFRKLDEIAKWEQLDQSEQLEILEKVQQRKNKLHENQSSK